MEKRIEQELDLLRQYFPQLEYVTEGRWVRIPSYSMPPDWNRLVTDVAFQIPVGYPGTPPYGFFVPSGLKYKDQKPNNYAEPASNRPPFGDDWGMFSWAPDDGQWHATAELTAGSNLLNWVLGFKDRLKQGV